MSETNHSEKNPDLASIFLDAIAIQDPQDRARMLDNKCSNPEMRRQVEVLIDAQGKAQDFLSRPPQELTLTAVPSGSHSSHAEGQPSVLTRLKNEFDVDPVFLKSDGPDDVEPIVRPHSTELPARRPDEKYQIQGEIARGGMGAVLKGRDVDLGRSLAIKVLLESHKNQPEVIQRFIEEAQIGGQLQHPGIAPVYELGQFDDKRPFFTMKLVKGKTLAKILLDRKNTSDRGKLLGIFEQVCQTMAYAHSRGVIHRDLKPSNIMVGAFGEVQVMDWGVAKVLEAGGIADERKAHEQLTELSVIQTARSEGSGPYLVGTDEGFGSQTIAGSVMGTPAYMPPEQACGDVDRLDERCDVFGLGAILCQILTGQPPYVDDNPKQILYMAQQAKLVQAFTLLDQSDADPSLIQLTKECLSPEMSDRPRNAEILTERVSEYLESVESRLHETELARVAEATRVVEERKRRKVAVALAASILLTFVLGTVAWIWNQQQVRQRQLAAHDKVNAAIGDARLHVELADSADLREQVAELDLALSKVNTAGELAAEEAVDEELRESVAQLSNKIDSRLEVARKKLAQEERNQKLKADLESIRLAHADGKRNVDATAEDDNFNKQETSERYRKAFQEAGLDIANHKAETLVPEIVNSPIRETIIVALDHWLRNHPVPTLHNKFYASMGAGSWKEACRVGLRRVDEQPMYAIRWLNVAPAIAATGDRQAYVDFCQRAAKQFAENKSIVEQERIIKACLILPDAIPLDELQEKDLFDALDRDSLPNNVRGFAYWLWTCRALWNYRKGNFEAAIEYVNESQMLDPKAVNCRAVNLCILALAEAGLKDIESAELRLQSAAQAIQHALSASTFTFHDSVIAWLLYREAEKKIHGEDTKSTFALDLFSQESKVSESDESRAVANQKLVPKLWFLANAVDNSRWRRAVRRALRNRNITNLKKFASGIEARGQSAELRVWLATVLRESKQTALAISLLESAQRENPGDFWVNYELGKSLVEGNRVEEGLGFSRAALALRPESNGAKWTVVAALLDSGKKLEAEAQFDKLLESSEFSEYGYGSLAYSLYNREIYNLADKAYRKAIQQDPERSRYHAQHGYVLNKLGRVEEAYDAYEKAIEVDPDSAYAHYKLGLQLVNDSKRRESIKHLKRAVELDPYEGAYHSVLGTSLEDIEELETAIQHHRRAVELMPFARRIREHLISALRDDGQAEAALEERKKLMAFSMDVETSLRKRLESNPKSAGIHYLLGRNLFEQRKYSEAETFLAEAVRLDKTQSVFHQLYGIVLRHTGKLQDSVKHLEKAIELVPSRPKYHYALARTWIAMDRDDKAIEHLKKAIKGNPKFTPPYRYLAILQGKQGKKAEALDAAKRADEVSPGDPRVVTQLGIQYLNHGDKEEAKKQFERAIELAPSKKAYGGYFMIGKAYMDIGDYAGARKIFQIGLELKQNPMLIGGTARSYMLDGYPDKALQLVDEAIAQLKQTNSNNVLNLARGIRGNCLIRLGRYEEAIGELENLTPMRGSAGPGISMGPDSSLIIAKCWAGMHQEAFEDVRKLVDENPDSYIAHNCWAWMLVMRPDKNGKFPEAEKAIEHAQQSVRIRPMSHNINTLGVAHYRADKWEAAINYLQRSIDMGNDRPENWIFLAMANAKLSNKDEADKWYQKCLEWEKPRTLYGETKMFYEELKEMFEKQK